MRFKSRLRDSDEVLRAIEPKCKLALDLLKRRIQADRGEMSLRRERERLDVAIAALCREINDLEVRSKSAA